MPSRSLPPESPSPSFLHPNRNPASRLLPPLPAATAATSVPFLLIFVLCFRKLITRKRTVPSDSKPPRHFSYSSIRRATNSFSPSLRLGQGGFGSVFRGSFPNGQLLAVKVMDSGSLQGEREFHNELFFSSKLESDYVVTPLGFSSDRKRRTMLLIYDLMPNGNLQDGLLRKKCSELMTWERRFSIAVDIAKGIAYLHSLNPPVIHGDIKPSNILLDRFLCAKIADFGLAWMDMENQNKNQCVVKIEGSDNGEMKLNNNGIKGEDCGSVLETESMTTTGFEEFNLLGVDQSPENSSAKGPVSVSATSPETPVEVVSASPEGNFDGASDENKGVKLKEDRTDMVETRVVNDYVIEWIGSEITTERPRSDWIGASSSNKEATIDKKKIRKRLDWWVSLEEEKDDKVLKKQQKRRQPREWWKEEYCEELEKKKKKKKKNNQEIGLSNDGNGGGEDWWPTDDELYVEIKKKKKKKRRHRSSLGSIDRFSGELFKGSNHISHESLSGEIPKSGGISSTPSTRGTVCYVAPEHGGGGRLSDKSDVYSFGVLLLVLVAGRRPLQVTSSPISEFQRANLIYWARHLARAGKLLDLVDHSVQCLDRDQALLCITVALLCLQKSPALRPSMTEVVRMLTGELETPQLPIEYSPSPPLRSKSGKRAQ